MHTRFQSTLGLVHSRSATSTLLAALICLLIVIVSAVPVRAQTFPFTAILNSGQEPPPKTTAAGSQQHTAPVSSNAAGSQQHTVPVSLPFADAEATGFLASDVLSRVFGNDIIAID